MAYDIAKHTRRCHATGRPLAPGEVTYSALVENPAGQERWDFSIEGWTGPPEHCVGYWRGRLPEEHSTPAKRPEPPLETMVDLFDRLGNGSLEAERSERLRYVLGLLLVRRRALKLHNLRRDGERQWLVVRKPTNDELLELPDPMLTDEESQILEQELHEWMHWAMSEEPQAAE